MNPSPTYIVIFKSPQLKPLQDVLDSRLKDLQSRQTPFRKTAKTLSQKNEQQLWLTGCLGTHCPAVLLDTLTHQRQIKEGLSEQNLRRKK